MDTAQPRQLAISAPHVVTSLAATRDAPLREYLKHLSSYLERPDVTEIVINRPSEVFVESEYGWERDTRAESITLEFLRNLTQLTATFNSQTCNEESPLLSGALPNGERIQIAIPPAVEQGVISITIRKPSIVTKTRAEYERDGLTDEVLAEDEDLSRVDRVLLDLKARRRFWDFFELAVRERKNLVISGATGSGKTTFGKTIVNFIPGHERLITIEDTREIFLSNHSNRVHLLYSAGGTGTSRIEAKELLQSCLRMKPDRILLAEIRSKVAYDYIVNVSSGHPGSITTVHAGSCSEAFEMLMLRMKESPEGRELAREDIVALLRAKIDVVIQMEVRESLEESSGRMKKKRVISEVYFDPGARRKTLA